MKIISASFFSIFLLLSCSKIKEKGHQIIEKAENKILPDSSPKKISIKEIVKEFKNDSSIHEINGIQVEDLFYKEYFVYTGKKERVIKGINKIEPMTQNKYALNSDCVLTPTKDFYTNIVLNQEKNIYTSFFWKFENLKDYEIYTAIKKLNAHYIIFDKNSDTIYHRMEEIKD